MKAQPATKSYVFDKGYKDVKNVMKKTWEYAFRPVKNESKRLKRVFGLNFIWGSLTFLCDVIMFTIITLAILAINLILSTLFIATVFIIGVFVYLFYSILWLADSIFSVLKGISSHCSICQNKFNLPYYKCPKCGQIHTILRPSVYGILKRKCLCGNKIPTTFFNGRGKLEAVCPVCGELVKDGGQHSEKMIPIVGGPSSGKTCFINMAITELEKVAGNYNLDFKYSPLEDDKYEENSRCMARGMLPQKTSDTRLKYYQFYLTNKGAKVKNLVNLCDVAGEVYAEGDDMNKQIGYKFADAFLMVLDPLSISKFRRELNGKIDFYRYAASMLPIDEALSKLITTLENMKCLNSKNMLKTDVVVVFGKCDIPSLDQKIGKIAVNKYMNDHVGVTEYQAQNEVCENFLLEYEEGNFLNSLKSKFRSIQFFTCSALGHVQNGAKFKPYNLADPLLWIIDKVYPSINLKDKWGKKI